MAVTLSDLSVADVSGMIAAAVAVIQIFIPLALPVILLGVLREEHSSATTTSAVSWSVIGRFLHASRWPTLLYADSAAIRGVPGHILFITRMKTILALLTAIAAVVTPLGLYQTIVEDDEWTENVSFHYIADRSQFGFGTPPRIDLPWSRVCGFFVPVECPNSFSNITTYSNETTFTSEVEYHDTHVPQYVIDAFQSGLENQEDSVSSIFDIQARSYSWELTDDDHKGTSPDNGQPYPIDSFRMIESNILADDYLAVEGLVVDMKNGGIGFRNHSAPPSTPYGSTWSEDLLFIEPESQCVDTNLTLDFSLPKSYREKTVGESYTNLVLTDRGGFANLNLTYPNYSLTNTQRNPQLWDRAYKGAWLNNVLSMFFLNVTNPRNVSVPDSRAFTYLNSHVGKKFPLMSESGIQRAPLTLNVNGMAISSTYGYYLQSLDDGVEPYNSTITNFTSPEKALYENPFNIDSSNFSTISYLCSGKAGQDDANLDNFVAGCGMVYGAPSRTDSNSSSIVFEPGSHWSVPMYSCIITAKATIKRVTFQFNGTDDLSGLKVAEINNKVYPDEESKPLWGVERSDKKLADVNLLWGLISSPDQGNISLHTLRHESLYLPGYEIGHPFSTSGGTENLPGADFYIKGITSVLSRRGLDFPDYTGQMNLAMYRRWQELSTSAETTAKILNLIWTDLSSNAVVGTRGLHGARKQGPYLSSNLEKRDPSVSEPSTNPPRVKSMHSRVRYRWAYAVPAFIVLFLTAVIALATLVFTFMGRVSMSRMRQYLNKTSQGRILTTYLYGQKSETFTQAPSASPSLSRRSTRRWLQNVGKNPVTVAEGANDSLVIHGSPRATLAAESADAEPTLPTFAFQ
ncbi:hypothetical protein VTN31DRAFT_2531 [Thermomyces dupontii]|uniref:uncharacterized protein n=1 Tax=Talaromyces thermophilus TaxID=28565 RepID=UPI0037448421